MKKLITILLVSFLAINTTFAQVDGEGTVILGATTELSETPWSMVIMTPTIGYFLSDQIAVGLMFSLDTEKQDFDVENFNSPPDKWVETTSKSEMSIGPWMRFYMGDIFFINAGVLIGSNNTTETTTDKDESGWYDSDGGLVSEKKLKGSTFTLDIGAGASILWGDHIAFEPMFGFRMGSGSDTDFPGNEKIKRKSEMDLGFKIGVCIMLGN